MTLEKALRNQIHILKRENHQIQTENHQIKTAISQIKVENSEIKTEIIQVKNENLLLREQLAVAIYKRFAGASEKFHPDQRDLFDFEQTVAEAETEEEAAGNAEKTEVRSHQRKKAGRKPLSDYLPRKEIVIDITEAEKQCACGSDLVKVAEERSERLQVIPAQIYVEVLVRPKYACRKCEGSGDEEKPVFRVASLPETILPGSIATAGLLSFIFTNKFCDHLPYYRQEKAWERNGVTLSRQNMSNWQTAVYEKLISLEKLMKNHLKSGTVMQMDETTVKVFGEEGREDSQKSYMWLARGGPPDKPLVLYQYRPTRAALHIEEYLNGFSGFLQTDGYEGYKTALKKHKLTHPQDEIKHVGCLAHVRRKFFDASKVHKKSKSPEEALAFIRKIYRAESRLREENLSNDDFLLKRSEQVKPLLAAFHDWLTKKENETPPSTLIGKAVSYALGQWEHVISYLNCPDLTPDNNACERSIRPFVLGRKNWLFSGSPEGAKSSCFLFSLIESAKENGLKPEEYLTHVFTKACLCKTEEDWQKLLPWNCVIETPVPAGTWV